MAERQNQREVIEAVKTVAKHFGYSEKDIMKIVKSQFEYVASEMASGIRGDESTYKSILLRHFGTFAFNKAKFRRINSKIKEKDEERQRALQSEE